MQTLAPGTLALDTTVAPISKRGNVAEIAKLFGGVEQLGMAVNQLQALLYAA